MAPAATSGVRAASLAAARVALLAGPTALAFFSGGYFDSPRNLAGAVAWLLVALAVVAGVGVLPRSREGRLAIGGLALLGAWTLLSITWAPIAGSAYHAGQIVFLYLGTLLAAAALLREPRAARIAEPALAAGALIVVGYGISERLLPGLLHFSQSVSAQGRLEQPLTYWNAMGELAAIGFVLCARIAGAHRREAWLRAAAAAAAVPLGLGLYLSFSRGALFACAAGLVTLVVASPWRAQLLSASRVLVGGAIAALVAAPFHGVTALSGALGTRERQGAVVLVALVVIAALSALAQLRLGPRESRELRLPRRAAWLALVVICAGLAVAILVGAKERSGQPLAPGATRLVSLQSNRYAYWRVAARAFRDQPLRGVGAGGWAVYWLRYRTIAEGAQDAHSLELQTAAELGLVGVALLAAFLGGIALVGREAHRAAPADAAGPIAALVVWLAHSPLDWDWQMPAVTLVAAILAGQLLALSRPAARGPIGLRGQGAISTRTG